MSLTPVMKCFELKQESFDISRDRHAKLISSKLTSIPFVKMSTSLANRICEIIAEKKKKCILVAKPAAKDLKLSCQTISG